MKEVKEASTRLKNVVGSEGTVVVGFWEDVTIFANSKAQYYDTYKEGYSKYFDIGDNRSVQDIFHEALEGMASPAKILMVRTFLSMLMNKVISISSQVEF